MDQFTKRYITGMTVLVLAGSLWWLASLDGRVRELNAMLYDNEFLASYPYQFRVIEITGDVAVMSSPRSAQLSAIQGLRAMYPALENESSVSDRMMSAQEDLARHQSLAARLVAEHPEVERVQWRLDEAWLQSHGIYVQD